MIKLERWLVPENLILVSILVRQNTNKKLQGGSVGRKWFQNVLTSHVNGRKGNLKSHVASVHEGKKHLNLTFVTTNVLKRET